MYLKTEFSNDDLGTCMENNSTDLFKYEDVEALIAEIPGHNDEDEWFWIGKLKDGRFFGARGGCDYTGWDCQSHCSYWVAPTAEEALKGFEKVADWQRIPAGEIVQLRAQLDEKQPFGMGVTVTP